MSIEHGTSNGNARGVWKPGLSLEGEAHLHQFDLSALPLPVAVNGRLSADAVLTSPDRAPALQATFNVDKGAVAGLLGFEALEGGRHL